MINIMLIDDHPLALNGIGSWLSGTGRFRISCAAKTLSEARLLLKQPNELPVIIILDVSLGAEDGLKFIPELAEICAARETALPGVIVCSMYEDPFLIQRALDSGARAYVAKSSDAREIIAAIDAILAGGTFVSPKYLSQLQKQTLLALTRREKEIISLVKQSISTRQIAKRLGISIRTVENHLVHIYAKTETASREELLDL